MQSALSLMVNLTKRDIRLRYLGSLLGSFWNVLHPLVMILIYTVIFSQVMRSRMGSEAGPYAYSLYLCSGLLAWNLFSEAVTRGTTTLLDNASFIKKLSLQPWILFGATLGSALFNFTIAFTLFSVALWNLADVNLLYYLAYLLVVSLFALFGIGLGVGLGCLNVFARDVQQGTTLLFSLWFWFTPIVYLVETLPPLAKTLVMFNPAYPYIESLHDLLYFNRLPDYRLFALMIVWCLLGWGFGAFIYRRTIAQVRDNL